MSKFNRPNLISDGAWGVLQALCQHFLPTDEYAFNIANAFDTPRCELDVYLQEIHDLKLAFWEHRHTDTEYLYMLPLAFNIAQGDTVTLYKY